MPLMIMKKNKFYNLVYGACEALNSKLERLIEIIEKNEGVHAYVVSVSDSPKNNEGEKNFSKYESEIAKIRQQAEENFERLFKKQIVNVSETDSQSTDEGEKESSAIFEEYHPFECEPGTVVDGIMIDATDNQDLDVNDN